MNLNFSFYRAILSKYGKFHANKPEKVFLFRIA